MFIWKISPTAVFWKRTSRSKSPFLFISAKQEAYVPSCEKLELQALYKYEECNLGNPVPIRNGEYALIALLILITPLINAICPILKH